VVLAAWLGLLGLPLLVVLLLLLLLLPVVAVAMAMVSAALLPQRRLLPEVASLLMS
jgi:hypothetical protein